MGKEQFETSGNKAELNANEPEVVKNTIINQHFSSLRGHWKKVAFLLVCYDILAVNLSYFLALWLRFDCKFNSITPEYITSWQRFVPIYTVFCCSFYGRQGSTRACGNMQVIQNWSI